MFVDATSANGSIAFAECDPPKARRSRSKPSPLRQARLRMLPGCHRRRTRRQEPRCWAPYPAPTPLAEHVDLPQRRRTEPVRHVPSYRQNSARDTVAPCRAPHRTRRHRHRHAPGRAMEPRAPRCPRRCAGAVALRPLGLTRQTAKEWSRSPCAALRDRLRCDKGMAPPPAELLPQEPARPRLPYRTRPPPPALQSPRAAGLSYSKRPASTSPPSAPTATPSAGTISVTPARARWLPDGGASPGGSRWCATCSGTRR